MHRFTCGEKKIWWNTKKPQNIMKMILGLLYEKMKVIQCKIASVIAGAIGGSSKEKLYQHLGLKTLQQRQW